MTDSSARWDMSADDATSVVEMRDYNGEPYPYCKICEKWADDSHMTSTKHQKRVDYLPRSSTQTPEQPLQCQSRCDLGMILPPMCLHLANPAGASTLAVGINWPSGQYLSGGMQYPYEFNREQSSRTLAEQIEEIVEEKLNQKMSAQIQENEKLKRRVEELERKITWWRDPRATSDKVWWKDDIQNW